MLSQSQFSNIMKYYIILILTLFIIGCLEEDLVINYGEDQCISCKMTISQANYGAALQTPEGRVYKYDALECMIRDISKDKYKASEYFAVAFDEPKILKPVESLHFVVDKKYHSPMGANLAAFSNPKSCMATEKMRNEAIGITNQNILAVEKNGLNKTSFDGDWSALKKFYQNK